MAQLFQDEKGYADNRQRKNFVFFGYPFNPPLGKDQYATVLKELEDELGLRLWYFLDEVTTDELMRKIWRAILRSDLAVFDVSGGNPNVAFELGLSVAIDRPCMTTLMQGAANPLGTADLGYAERTEYNSAATLKERLRQFLKAKSSALRLAHDVSYQIFDSDVALTHVQIENALHQVLKTVYKNKRIAKGQAEKIFGDRFMADQALAKLRTLNVLQMEGKARGASYVFSEFWVYHDHEVAGV
jgi:hypothetical protein